LVPNSSQNCTPKYCTKLARLPARQSQTKGRKTKKLKRKGAQFFCKVSSLWADLAAQEQKQGVQEIKTRRKTSHSKSLQRMTWSEGFGKTISRTKIFPKKFPNFSFANKYREKEVSELQEMKLSIYKIDLIH
jgi:hypothetical protein